ncbi:polyprenyl synthetase family protein [Streptomyces sp. NBC_00316]|uniref:polyprenyl synthetase family protein n=1 Tax=Streptomyces sp. NBC_00316 TaxID=2975710 RepID=UPI002E2A57CF|nr:polyprenyl synthetase family protein [Streptomyces sp. NBC_00316]
MTSARTRPAQAVEDALRRFVRGAVRHGCRDPARGPGPGGSDELLHTSGLSAPVPARVAPVWSALRAEVLQGQQIDVTAEVSGAEDVDTPLRVNEYKAVSCTVSRPLHIGAAIAGADAGFVAAYQPFGHDIGIAFQLRDDLPGVFGNPEEAGKPSGDDLSRASAPCCSRWHCITPTSRTRMRRSSSGPGSGHRSPTANSP